MRAWPAACSILRLLALLLFFCVFDSFVSMQEHAVNSNEFVERRVQNRQVDLVRPRRQELLGTRHRFSNRPQIAALANCLLLSLSLSQADGQHNSVLTRNVTLLFWPLSPSIARQCTLSFTPLSIGQFA